MFRAASADLSVHQSDPGDPIDRALFADLFVRRGLSIDRLRAFLAVAEAGSIDPGVA